MNFAQVQKILTDLPSTFLRRDHPFTQWLDAFTAELVRDTGAVDQITNQVQNITQAQFGWQDVWGLLFGVPRFTNEAGQTYIDRVQYIVNAGGGTPVGIVNWIQAVWQVQVTLLENSSGVGYTIIFPSSISNTQIHTIIASLGRIRPAGVPIAAVYKPSDGLYVETINFLGAEDVTGAYLSNLSNGVDFNLYPATNSSEPLLPSLFLTDPTLNPTAT